VSLPHRVIIRPFGDSDPFMVAELLQAASPEYVRFFRPFEFSCKAIEKLAWRSEKDQWFAVEIEQGGGFQAAGFYMLRGLDEGFADPMYGVFIAENFHGCGLARATLAHAEAMCRLNGWPNLLLKVDPENTQAFGLYEAGGFRFARIDPTTGNQVLIKAISQPALRDVE